MYLTKDTNTDYIDRDIVYSILDKHPKRARAWWFVNVETMDEPYTFAYSVETFRTLPPPVSCRRKSTTTRSTRTRATSVRSSSS